MDNELLKKIARSQEQMHLEMKEVKKDTQTIKRAIYGDSDNLVKGLIHRQVDDENRLKKLEDIKKKFIYAAIGFIAALKAIEIIFFK